MPDIEYAKFRLERWASWRHDQDTLNPNLSRTLLGKMIYEGLSEYSLNHRFSSKPFACLIHGTGERPESQDDDAQEWETQRILDSMPPHLHEWKWVLIIDFMRGGGPGLNAAKLKMGLETYRAHLLNGLKYVARQLSDNYE